MDEDATISEENQGRTTRNGAKTTFTKAQKDLMICLNSPEFKAVIENTVYPQIKDLGDKLQNACAAIASAEQRMSQQAGVIGQLREQLIACNTQLKRQDETINQLRGSIAITKTTLNTDKKDQLLQLKIAGLEGESEEELKNKLVDEAGKLNPSVELSAETIKLQIIKPKPKEGKPLPPPIHIFTIENIWKKRELYSARRQLFSSGVFLSENLGPKQRALQFRCRQLKREGKIQATWSNELVIFIKTNDGASLPITKEADLAPFTVPFPPQYSNLSGVPNETPRVFTEPPSSSTPMPGHYRANIHYQTPGPAGSVVHHHDLPPPPPPRRNLFPSPPPAAGQVEDFDLIGVNFSRRG